MLDKSQVVAELDMLCPRCQVHLQLLQPFGEVEKGIRCPQCHDYLYWVGAIGCAGTGVIRVQSAPEQLARMKALVGEQSLRPWALEKLKDDRAKLGLPPLEDKE